jgi:ABC-type uncharacterized transport system involved in gliding motility auxiliary subunit
MDRSFRNGMWLLTGLVLFAGGLSFHAIFLQEQFWSYLVAAAGLLLAAWAAFQLRAELGALLKHRRGEIALYTLGGLGVLVALAYFSLRFPARIDLTTAGLYSLSKETRAVLDRVDKPVRIVFFHDRQMREAKELLQLYARYSDKLAVEFYDPAVNPAQARLFGVRFPGVSILESDGRRLTLTGGAEVDFTNGILRVTQAALQQVCFLQGHREADPFNLESHDHKEGTGHSHGFGIIYVIHEVHGMGKARHALEATNYKVTKFTLVQGQPVPPDCSVLVVAGPKVALLAQEVEAVRSYLAKGGNAFFMLDPFIQTGLEPVLLEFGVVLDDDMILDEASHFGGDPSAPAVSDYNRHQVTRDLPLSFFPGARSLSPAPEPPKDVHIIPLVSSSVRSYGETDHETARYDRGKDLPGPATIMIVLNKQMKDGSPASSAAAQTAGEPEAAQAAGSLGEEAGATPTRRTRPRAQRLAVAGDADFATNSFFHVLGNGALFVNTINYLAAQENLIGISPRTYDLPHLNLTNIQIKATFFLSVVLFPAIAAVIGVAVWWKQR